MIIQIFISNNNLNVGHIELCNIQYWLLLSTPVASALYWTRCSFWMVTVGAPRGTALQ